MPYIAINYCLSQEIQNYLYETLLTSLIILNCLLPASIRIFNNLRSTLIFIQPVLVYLYIRCNILVPYNTLY